MINKHVDWIVGRIERGERECVTGRRSWLIDFLYVSLCCDYTEIINNVYWREINLHARFYLSFSSPSLLVFIPRETAYIEFIANETRNNILKTSCTFALKYLEGRERVLYSTKNHQRVSSQSLRRPRWGKKITYNFSIIFPMKFILFSVKPTMSHARSTFFSE